MDSAPQHSPALSASLGTREQLARIEEPWLLNKIFAVVAFIVLALTVGFLAGSGLDEDLILLVVWVVAIGIIVFVRAYWWTPALVINALCFKTFALGFAMSGLEVGIFILALTFPIKMAMKTLRPAHPVLRPGLPYWLLIGFLCVHCIIILFYNRIEGVQLKNIIKAYYEVITPLAFYGLLMRYCDLKTVRPSAIIIFWITAVVTIISIPVVLIGVAVSPLSSLKVSVDWTSSLTAAGIIRQSGLFLFVAALAWLPVTKSGLAKLTVLGMVLLGIGATLVGGARASVIEVICAAIFFAIVRKKLWMLLISGAFVMCLAGIITARPEILDNAPGMIGRSLVPLNLSKSENETKDKLGGSDQWHADLRNESIPYWLEDPMSMFFGHGYKAWDDDFTKDPEHYYGDYHLMLTTAIEMGMTENMFSALTNIYGGVGLLLYGGFLLHLCFRLWKGCKLAPVGTAAHAFCEFSLVNLVLALIFSPFLGATPSINLIFWVFGVLGAREYLGEPEEKREPVPLAAGASVAPERFGRRLAAARVDPFAEFARRQRSLPGFQERVGRRQR